MNNFRTIQSQHNQLISVTKRTRMPTWDGHLDTKVCMNKKTINKQNIAGNFVTFFEHRSEMNTDQRSASF